MSVVVEPYRCIFPSWPGHFSDKPSFDVWAAGSLSSDRRPKRESRGTLPEGLDTNIYIYIYTHTVICIFLYECSYRGRFPWMEPALVDLANIFRNEGRILCSLLSGTNATEHREAFCAQGSKRRVGIHTGGIRCTSRWRESHKSIYMDIYRYTVHVLSVMMRYNTKQHTHVYMGLLRRSTGME